MNEKWKGQKYSHVHFATLRAYKQLINISQSMLLTKLWRYTLFWRIESGTICFGEEISKDKSLIVLQSMDYIAFVIKETWDKHLTW